MGPPFDPYYNWLGIPAAEQPPHYYRLLGLAPLESNPTVIEHAADRVMIHLRTFAAGPHGVASQQLLNEVATARVTLLDAARKSRYDADLQARLGLTGARPAPANRESRLPQATALPPMPVQVPVPLQPTGQPMASLAAVVPVAIKTAPTLRKSRPGRKRAGEVANPEAAAIINTVKIVMGALGGLSMAILLVWLVFGIDALGLFPKKGKEPEEFNNHVASDADAARGSAAATQQESTEPPPAMKQFDGALAAFKQGQYQQALSGIDAALKSLPKDPVLHETRALCLFALGRYKDAAATLHSLRASAPGMDSRSMRSLYGNADDYTLQLRKLETHVKNNPTDAPAMFVLAYHSLVNGQNDTAIKALQEVVKLQPKNATAQRMLAALAPPEEQPKDTPPPAPDPPSPPETPFVVAPTPPTPAGAAADARQPDPSEEAQKAKFEEFKSLYSKEFADAERASAREKFPDFLIAKADAIKSDPVARYAILWQAYTRLISAKDFHTAVEIVDLLEQEYQVDELEMRVQTLKAASAARQTAAEKQSLARCFAYLAELALRRQRMDHAPTLSRMAENLSRTLQDKAFRERTITLKEEVEKAQAEWGKVEGARKTLEATPDDAAAALVVGRYRCLVAGDWATGVPVLAMGGADPVAAAARLDLGGASDPKAAATIADAWYDLAKSDDKLKPLYARALHWYRKAVANSTGADQVPWLQRVELIEGLQLPERYLVAVHDSGTREPLPPFVSMFFRNVEFKPIDCIARLDRAVVIASPWTIDSATSIYCKPGLTKAMVPTNVLAANVPREYQVSVRVRNYYSGPDGPFVIGLVGPKGQFAVVLDMPIATEFGAYITLSDGKPLEQNPTLVRYARQHILGEETVLVQVRRNGVTVQIDNRVVTQFEGDLDKVASLDWTIPKFNGLRLGAHQGSYLVSSWFLQPVARAPRLGKTPEPPAVPGLPNAP